MDVTDRQTPQPTAASTEDYWAKVQELRAQLAQLRPSAQPVRSR